MKTNNTVINSIMNKYMKYICAILLVIGTSVSAWATVETLDFTQCWGIGTTYDEGVYTYNGYAIEAHHAKYNQYNDYWILNYYYSDVSDHNGWGGIILPPFNGTVSSISVTSGSGSGATVRYIDLYVNGTKQASSTGIAASGTYTFTSLSIAAGSTIELRNNTNNNEFHLASLSVTHNGSQMGTAAVSGKSVVSTSADGNGTITVSSNPVNNDATTTLTAVPASGWTFDYWEVTSVGNTCTAYAPFSTRWTQNEFTADNIIGLSTDASIELYNYTYPDYFIAVAHFIETTCTIDTKVVFANSGTQNVNASTSAQTFDNAGTAKRDDNNANTGQTVSYTSSNPSVTVNSSGRVSIPANFIGSVTITATAGENGDYCESSASYTLNVNGYTVTYHYPSSCSASTPANVGAPGVIGSHSLPTNMGVDGYQFVGWTTNSSFADGNSAPDPLYTSSVTVTSNINLYAAYKKVSSTFEKMPENTSGSINTSVPEGDYVICTNYDIGSTARVMTNNLDGNNRMSTDATEYTFTAAGLSCTDEEYIWHISGSAGNYLIYNAYSGKYLAATSGATGSSDRKVRLVDESSDNYAKWTIEQNNGRVPYMFTNTKRKTDSETEKSLGVSSNNIFFRGDSYKASFYLFKRTSTSNAYTINPDCDAAEFTVTFNLGSAPAGATVTASATGATFSSPVLSPVTSGTSVTIGVTAPTGYHFDHWTVTSGGASLSSAATVASNGFTMPASNVVLTPVFAPNEYTITYLDKGGSAFSGTHDVGYPTTHTYGTATTLFGATKAGWEFAGWYTTSACTSGTQVTTLGATDYTAGITLYALWVHFTDPLAWCPEPELVLTGTTYITSLYHADNGGMIRGAQQLSITGRNMGINEDVTITSNNANVYFSLNNTDNIKRTAEAKKPKTTLTLKTDANGKLNGDAGYTIYVHLMPSAAGDGSISDVTVTATYAVSEPDEVSTTHVYVRNMPTQFAIATKIGSTWYALPADMTSPSNPEPVQIEVNETNWTAKGPATVGYAMWPVRTVDSDEAEYATKGSWLRFAGQGGYGLWANNSSSQYTIKIDNSSSAMDNSHVTGNAYMWEAITTPTNALAPASGTFKYTLQTHQANNENYLNIKTNEIIWGTYQAGYQLTNEMYLLPLTPITPFEYQVIEWYPTKMLIQTDATISSPTITIDGETVASPTVTAKGSKWYEIGNLPLEANPAKTMVITNSGASCVKTIPVIISRGTKNISEAPFSTLGKAVYNHTDLVVRDGAVLTVNGSATDNEFHDVTIYPTSKISVPALNTNDAENKLGVHSLTFFGGIDEIYNGSSYTINKYGVPELSLKGKFGTKTVTKIDYIMRVDLSQMYSLTVPYDVNLSDVTYWDGTAMTPGSNLYAETYNGQARANKDMGNTWTYETDFAEAKFKAGVGYTISAELQTGVGATYSIIRMPMNSNVGTNATEVAKTVPVTAYANTNGLTTVGDNDKGWNLVGNPYMATISGGEADSKLVVGYLKAVSTGYEWHNDSYRYVTIPFDNGTDYYQQKFSSAELKPFKNFFLQIGTSGDLAFALASRQNMPALYTNVVEREVEFEIELANETRTDHIGLLIAEQYSPAYEINADLEKMIGSMSVYTIYGGYNLAYNALSPDDAAQAIPMGYVANVAGTYTFDLADDGDFNEIEHIWLTDYELERTIDLLNGSYEFTTIQGRNDSRFAISVELKEIDDTPTDLRDVDDGEGQPLKFIYRDKMYILNNGILYDATGKRVK